MAKKLGVGSRVQCRLFNTPDNEFYGDYFEGEVIEVIEEPSWTKRSGLYYVPDRPGYKVRRDDGTVIELKRKEIKRILS